jgi:cytochrome P450
MAIPDPIEFTTLTSQNLDIDPRYPQLRRESPVIRVHLPSGDEAWLVTRYDDACRVLSDPRFSRTAAVGRNPGGIQREDNLIDMDPPRHTRISGLVVEAFSGTRVAQLRPRIHQITHRLLDAMIDHGQPADLVEHLSLPLSVTVISELLGVPVADRDQFTEWADAFLSTTAVPRSDIEAAHDHLEAYFAKLIAQRREEPADDLLTELVAAHDTHDALTEQELINLGVGLLIAAYEPTASQLSNMIFTLFSHPAAHRRLLERPELLPDAIEELLRYLPLGSDPGMPRVAREDVELGGMGIRRGDMVFVARAAASRDESVWADGERLDLERKQPAPHLAFGHGIHECVGAELARMELQAAIGALLTRFPRLRLALPPERVQWKSGVLVRGPQRLPVLWD